MPTLELRTPDQFDLVGDRNAEPNGSEYAGRERRGSERSEFAYKLWLTPIGAEFAGTELRDGFEVLGSSISATGFGFLHSAPLPFRNVRINSADPRLDELGLGRLQMDLVLKWCRFLRPGQYESGGRIARSHALVA